MVTTFFTTLHQCITKDCPEASFTSTKLVYGCFSRDSVFAMVDQEILQPPGHVSEPEMNLQMDRRRAEEEGGPPPPRPAPVPAKREPTPPPVTTKDRRASAAEPERKREERPVREWDRGKRSRSPERGAVGRTRSRSRERVRDKDRERERERRHREQERSKERKEKKRE